MTVGLLLSTSVALVILPVSKYPSARKYRPIALNMLTAPLSLFFQMTIVTNTFFEFAHTFVGPLRNFERFIQLIA